MAATQIQQIELPPKVTQDKEALDGGTPGSEDFYKKVDSGKKWDQLDQDILVEQTKENKN